MTTMATITLPYSKVRLEIHLDNSRTPVGIFAGHELKRLKKVLKYRHYPGHLVTVVKVTRWAGLFRGGTTREIVRLTV